MAISLNELGETLLEQLSDIISGGGDVEASPDSFVTWCQPGLPFQPEDFDFAVKGVGGGVDAEEDKLLLQQAFNFAQLIDFIPDAQGVYASDDQERVFRTSQGRMSHMYGEILRLSKVVTHELSGEEKAKLEKFRNLLYEKKTTKNIVTDEETEVTVEGPVLRAYNEKMAAYIDAALLYNSKRVAAAGATGPEGKAAVQDWASNEQFLRMKVKAAENDWVAGGFRNEVDQMNAFIDAVTQRDMQLWKAGLLDNYESAKLSGLQGGQEFLYSTVVPGNFARSEGWTEYSVHHSETDAISKSKRKTWKAGGKVGWGLASVGASGSGSSSKTTGETSVSNFRMSFQLTQVLPIRSWMYPLFFKNRGWTLRPGDGWNFDAMPSDGGDPPSGLLVGYPTSIIFARNIEIESAEFASEFETFSKSLEAGGGGGWGPFKVSGTYGSEESGRTFRSELDGSTLKVPGMQIIGFGNHLIGKAPDRLEGIDDAAFQ